MKLARVVARSRSAYLSGEDALIDDRPQRGESSLVPNVECKVLAGLLPLKYDKQNWSPFGTSVCRAGNCLGSVFATDIDIVWTGHLSGAQRLDFRGHSANGSGRLAPKPNRGLTGAGTRQAPRFQEITREGSLAQALLMM